MAKLKGLYPAPVYEAHFQDGSIVRMSFYQESGKPWAYMSGARTCALANWENPGLNIKSFNRASYVPGRLSFPLLYWNNARYRALKDKHFGMIFAPRKPLDWLGVDENQIVDGYVIHDDKIMRDPRFTCEPKHADCTTAAPVSEKKTKITAAQLKAVLAKVLEGDEMAIATARPLLAA